MKTNVEKMRPFREMHGWANRILRVDVGTRRASVHEAEPWVPEYLGGRGIAARICWEEYPEPVDPFHPDNPLMVFAGALTGSRAPYAGRASICAFSPQGYPHGWFTRSTIGGHFGAELKRAGYDGLIVTGQADEPLHLRIRDDEVSLQPASELWGLDALDSLEALAAQEGRGVRGLVIGPAGERLSRIATIQTASSSASGQGGFGAVMGAKRLKAISVVGSGRVSLADPDRISALNKALVRLLTGQVPVMMEAFGTDLDAVNRRLAAAGDGRMARRPCTESCLTPCTPYFREVPGTSFDREWRGSWSCVGQMFRGSHEIEAGLRETGYDWQMPHRAAFELNLLSNRYGLNQFDLLMGMVPWLRASQKAGLINSFNGQEIDWHSPAFWLEVLQAIAHRTGMGDVLAEGGWAAARQLGLGLEQVRRRYPAWGYAANFDGHAGGDLAFPYWLVSALQWMADTRDPFASGHGYGWASSAAERAAALEDATERESALDLIRSIGQRVYGSPDSVDPFSGYSGKAAAGVFQTRRAVLRDCLPLCSIVFPLIYRAHVPGHWCKLSNVDGWGEIDGTSIEYHIFAAGTGVDWSEAQFLQAAERICTLERAIQVRHWGRNRQTDEMALPYFEQPELRPSPFLKERRSLDPQQFRPVVDEFYALQGWDTESGWPSPERLRQIGLDDVHGPMVEGASRAGQRPTVDRDVPSHGRPPAALPGADPEG